MQPSKKSARKLEVDIFPLESPGDHLAQYAVLGNPIQHSLSPYIHKLFADQTQQSMAYSAILVALNDFSEIIKKIQKNMRGINITAPFKKVAYHLVDQCTERAHLAQAVNTISFNHDGSIYGDNTDGYGLLKDLKNNLNILIHGQRILILGAGGAVQGILGPLLAEQPDFILIANRTKKKAQFIADSFSHLGKLSATSLTSIKETNFDIILNTLTQSILLPKHIINEQTICYDLVYTQTGDTPFLKWAKQHPASSYYNGIGMLVEQAAESFFVWRGIKPKTQLIISMLKKMLYT